jgi:membrane-bound lytic murein transglycosylase B
MPNLIFLCLLIISFHTQAKTAAELQHDFIQNMVEQHGFKAKALQQLFADIKIEPPIINKVNKPAEKKLDWGRYRKIFLTEKRIAQGVTFWQDNLADLARAEAEFGVPASIIVAIIGVETYYGRITGKHSVLRALSTLGFYHTRRGKFFRSELSHFLRLAREEGIDPREPKGSYAGAMGRPQFIPSSYRHYAIDFDNDGKRDIWHNNTDVIGSVASYFAKHGWQPGKTVTIPISNITEQHAPMIAAGYKPRYPLATLREAGIQLPSTLNDKQKGSVLALKDGNTTEHWLGLRNFYVITRYNHSPLYAMAVYQLSEAIRERKTTP